MICLLLTAFLVACGVNEEVQAPAEEAVFFATATEDVMANVLDGATVSGKIRVEVQMPKKVRRVEFFLDREAGDGSPDRVDGGAPWNWRIDTRELEDGPHSLAIRARAKGGAIIKELTFSIEFIVDNVPGDDPPADDPAEGDSDEGEPDEGEPEPQPEPQPEPEPEPKPITAASCLTTHDGPLVRLTGKYGNEYEARRPAAETRFDNRGASFIMPAVSGTGALDPFTVNGGSDVCISGGVYSPGIPDDTADWEKFHHSQGIYIIDNPRPVVESVALIETGDGVRFKENTPDWIFRDSYVGHAGDDAIENDLLYGGVIDDVLVDWGYVFFSCRLGSGNRGEGYPPGGLVTIQDTMVALRPQEGGYREAGTGGRFFKMEHKDGPGCTVSLKNNVFLVEEGKYADLSLDPNDDPQVNWDALVESENNVIVWLGEGDYPARIPEGFTLTRDITVWEKARDAWFDRHPQHEQFR